MQLLSQEELDFIIYTFTENPDDSFPLKNNSEGKANIETDANYENIKLCFKTVVKHSDSKLFLF